MNQERIAITMTVTGVVITAAGLVLLAATAGQTWAAAVTVGGAAAVLIGIGYDAGLAWWAERRR